jgi:alpha-mannosidase/mannosylglycerate hydrolase
MESTVRDLPERPIALTLFRATRRTVMTDGQPEGQIQGPLRFQYWIVPFAGTLPRTRLCQLGQQLGAGLRTAQLQPRHFVSIPCEGPRLAPQGGLLEITGDAVCTSICQVDGGTEVRLFNPGDRATTVRIQPGKATKSSKPWTKAQPVDLESHPLGKPAAFAGAFKTALKPKKIVTLRFTSNTKK